MNGPYGAVNYFSVVVEVRAASSLVVLLTTQHLNIGYISFMGERNLFFE